MAEITYGHLTFETFIDASRIQSRVAALGAELSELPWQDTPLLLVVLNGSFMFAADLCKHITIDCEISFVKLSSYQGMQNTGKIKELIGLNESIEGKEVVVIEDIVDTGHTIHSLLEQLKPLRPKSLKVCTLLEKPEARKIDYQPEFVGFSIPNAFVIGYGLDLDGKARNLPDIYQLKTT